MCDNGFIYKHKLYKITDILKVIIMAHLIFYKSSCNDSSEIELL